MKISLKDSSKTPAADTRLQPKKLQTLSRAAAKRLAGHTIIFSGFRDPELVEKIRVQGGTYSTRVPPANPGKLILVVKSLARQTTKTQQIRSIRGAKVYTIEQFNSLLSGQRVGYTKPLNKSSQPSAGRSSGRMPSASSLLEKYEQIEDADWGSETLKRAYARGLKLSKKVYPEVYAIMQVLGLTLDCKLSKPSRPISRRMWNQITDPDTSITSLKWRISSRSRKLLRLIGSLPVMKAKKIIYSPRPQFRTEIIGASNKGITVNELLRVILLAEKAFRNDPRNGWIGGGPNINHVYFEGFSLNKNGTWAVVWGS